MAEPFRTRRSAVPDNGSPQRIPHRKNRMGQKLVSATVGTKDKESNALSEKMWEFTRGHHDTLILDEVRDLNFLIQH